MTRASPIVDAAASRVMLIDAAEEVFLARDQLHRFFNGITVSGGVCRIPNPSEIHDAAERLTDVLILMRNAGVSVPVEPLDEDEPKLKGGIQ